MLLNLPGIFKSLIKILLLMVKTMVRLVQLWFMKNPMQAVLEIFLLAVGVPCIIVLIAAENAIVTLIVMIYAHSLLSTNFPACDPIMCCYSYRVWSVRSRITS
jgi:hypothetical protein